ncbi:MAG: hypothetical protein AM326_07485 [Candidatus Thorarchaeota archaeon SMTZ-45]|nr:MAG: hypothetical protein AM325_10355 [Candidatus Thorarchaeota archaeon SMTZ1-45]KXH76183.1 MAG: hypothetical protein AM326_07485 [Candidatus Thorarchaeota archaeon SMTZ-45]
MIRRDNFYIRRKSLFYLCEMNSEPRWKLQTDDSDIEEFIDIRRKVGNQIIREYLLDGVENSERIDRVSGKLRGPKNEFKDFANFLILKLSVDGLMVKFLAEAGVYDNLRIVAVDSKNLAERSSDDIIRIFTEALENPDSYNTKVVLSDDSTVR